MGAVALFMLLVSIFTVMTHWADCIFFFHLLDPKCWWCFDLTTREVSEGTDWSCKGIPPLLIIEGSLLSRLWTWMLLSFGMQHSGWWSDRSLLLSGPARVVSQRSENPICRDKWWITVQCQQQGHGNGRWEGKKRSMSQTEGCLNSDRQCKQKMSLVSGFSSCLELYNPVLSIFWFPLFFFSEK